MAVTVISNPEGYKLSTTPITAYVDDVSGDARVVKAAHGLSTGQTIYIESNIDAYNGFKKVGGTITDSFFILDMDGSSIDFKQQENIFYYVSELDHGWQCVHLPIVYELESNLYPVNSVDTVITISPYGYINGYFAVTHSALTGSDELFALDYVKLADGRILQVVEIVSSTITVLNFDGSGTIATMQKVRNNYHVLVNVYAGLPVGHPWETEKPYELATTLRFIPDSDNTIKFSIAEILKGYIITRNNLALDTLPNNIDFMTAFYIEFTEAYDVSNGTEVTVFEDEFEEDDFEGYAVNAMLPFKNIYSGWMSDYLLSDANPKALFLTTFAVPSLYENYFFDISILVKEGLPQLFIKKVWYFVDGAISHTEEDEILDFNEGIYRIQLEPVCTATEEITLITYISSHWEGDMDGWSNLIPGIDTWYWSDSPDYFSDVSGYVIKNLEEVEYIPLSHSISLNGGENVRIKVQFGGIKDMSDFTLEIYLFDSVNSNAYLVWAFLFEKNTSLGDDFLTGVADITTPSDDPQIHFDSVYFILKGDIEPGNRGYVNYFEIKKVLDQESVISKVVISVIDGGGSVYTEEKTINVICECGDTFVNDELRLIETSPFRELE